MSLSNPFESNGSTDIETESVTEEELLHTQALAEGEPQPENVKALQTFPDSDRYLRSRISSRSLTGLPESEEASFQATSGPSVTSHSATTIMGSSESKQVNRNDPKYIISEDPQFLHQRKRIVNSPTTGNCIPWSDHVYYKLFLDTEGRNARLMVLKCEISYIDVFSDEEHSLYKSRFIGGKADGVAELLSFDLMKSDWEMKIPQSQAIELNMDIVMSSSPIHQCSETLLNLLQLEKSYLKHQHFDGQLNVTIRFAHPYAWDVKDDVIRSRVHGGLCNLFREGVDLEVLSADGIFEEMRVDGILASNDEKINHYIAKRNSWNGSFLKNSVSHETTRGKSISSETTPFGIGSQNDVTSVKPTSSRANETIASMTDLYHVSLHGALWDIIQDTKRIRGILEETVHD